MLIEKTNFTNSTINRRKSVFIARKIKVIEPPINNIFQNCINE